MVGLETATLQLAVECLNHSTTSHPQTVNADKQGADLGKVASFPGLQFLIACSMQIKTGGVEGLGVGTRLVCSSFALRS